MPEGGGERVLVVDDDATVLRMMDTILARFGYDVVEANGPDTALERLRELDAPPALSIIDASRPRRSGIELASELRELGQIDTLLLVSGYATSGAGDTDQLLGRSNYLEKPFSVGELLRAVGRCIDAGRERGEGAA